MPFGGNFHPEWGTLVPAPSFMRTARIVAVATAIGATAGAGVVLSLAGSGGALGPLASSDAGGDQPPVIVHSLVQPAEAAPVATAQPAPSPIVAAAPVNVPAVVQPPVNTASAPAATPPPTSKPMIASAPVDEPVPVRPIGEAAKNAPPVAASAQAATPAPSDSQAASTPAVPASVAALAEIPAATEALSAPGANEATFIPDHSGAQKVGSKKPHNADQTQHPQTAAATAQNPPKRKPEQRGLGSLLRHLFTARSASSYPN